MTTQSTQPRTYSAAHFALELDNKQDVGIFRSIEGGGVKADVMTYQAGGIHDKWRQLGKAKFEDIKLQVGMSMSKPFYDWIEAFFDGAAVRKDGAIIAADFYYNERARREFKDAMIKELTFPKLDGSDKNAAYMTLALAVEDIVFKKGTGNKVQQSPIDSQKVWTACNFRFVLDGFEQACKRVSKIDSFTIKQTILEYQQGGSRIISKTPSQIDFPQISFYVPEADADPFLAHFKAHAIDGTGNSHAGKRAGMIETYDNQNKNLFTLQFFESDIVAVTHDKADSSTEEIKQVKIDIYTERMEFAYAAMDVM